MPDEATRSAFEQALIDEEERLKQAFETAGNVPGAGVRLMPPPRPEQQGRVYMGPSLSSAEENQFMASAPGTRISLIQPPSPEQQAQRSATLDSVPGAQNMEDVLAQRRVAALSPETSTTLSGVSRPPYAGQDVFEARLNIQNAIRQGMPEADAFRMYGGNLFTPLTKPMTEYQQVSTNLRQQEQDRLKASGAARERAAAFKASITPPPMSWIDKNRWAEAEKEKASLIERLDAFKDAPEVPAWNDQLNQVLDVQESIARRYHRQPTTGTTTTPAPSVVPVTPPEGTPRAMPTTGTVVATARVKVRNPQGKVGTIPASQLDDAIKAGWKKL